jgi:cyanophycinase
MSRSIRAVSGFVFVFAFAAALCPGRAVIARSPAPTGHLLIIGGNGTTDEIVKRAVELGGGAKGSVAIFPQASELPETGPDAVKTWTAAGLGAAVVVDPKDPAAVKAVKDATFIWFPGGDQNRLTKALENTGIPEAIRARYAEGALVGGTSAGAAVMSRLMLTGEADLQNITAGKTETAPGLALFPDVIVDQHFLKRQRANRLISAVLDHPDLVGIGIDETTAVLVSGRTFEVLGKNSVVVIDARRAAVDKVPAGQLATGRNLTLSVLKAGMKYSLDRP